MAAETVMVGKACVNVRVARGGSHVLAQQQDLRSAGDEVGCCCGWWLGGCYLPPTHLLS